MFNKESFKVIRKDKNLTQRKLAVLMQRGERTIQRWETGEKIPSASDIRVLAQILNIPLHSISDLNELEFSEKKYIPKDNNTNHITTNLEGHYTIKDKIYFDEIQQTINRLKNDLQRVEKEKADLSIIAHSIPTLIYKKDINLNFTFANKTFLSYVNLSEHDVIGKKTIYHFNTDECNILEEIERNTLKENQSTKRQIYLPGSQKKRKAIISTYPIRESNGSASGVIAFLEDITDTDKAFEQYQILEKTINASNNILWINKFGETSSSFFYFINKAVQDISGYHSDLFYSDSNFWLKNVVHEKDRAKAAQAYKECSSLPVKYRIKTSAGTIKFVEEQCFKYDSLFFGIIRDITKENEMQDDLNLLYSVFKVIPTPLWISTDFGRKMKLISDTIRDITGIERASFEKDPSILLSIFKDKESYQNWYDSVSTDKWWNSKNVKNFVCKNESKVFVDKQEKWIENQIFSTPELKEQGIRFGIIRDITAERQNNLEKDYICKYINKIDSFFWVAEKSSFSHNEYNVLALTEGFEKIFGKRTKPISKIENIWNKMTHPDDLYLLDIDPSKKKFPIKLNYRIIKDGETHWLNECIYEHDNIYFGVTADITKEKLLIEENTLLGEILDDLPFAIWVSDKNNKTVIPATKGFEKILNISFEVLKSFPEIYENKIYSEDKDNYLKWKAQLHMEEWWESKTANTTKLTYRIFDKNGKIKWIEETIMTSAHLKKKGIRLGIFRDMTDFYSPIKILKS